jgi:hypothetical protein
MLSMNASELRAKIISSVDFKLLMQLSELAMSRMTDEEFVDAWVVDTITGDPADHPAKMREPFRKAVRTSLQFLEAGLEIAVPRINLSPDATDLSVTTDEEYTSYHLLDLATFVPYLTGKPREEIEALVERAITYLKTTDKKLAIYGHIDPIAVINGRKYSDHHNRLSAALDDYVERFGKARLDDD